MRIGGSGAANACAGTEQNQPHTRLLDTVGSVRTKYEGLRINIGCRRKSRNPAAIGFHGLAAGWSAPEGSRAEADDGLLAGRLAKCCSCEHQPVIAVERSWNPREHGSSILKFPHPR